MQQHTKRQEQQQQQYKNQFFLPQEAVEDMSHMLENQLFAAAQVIEQQLDQEFDRLDNLDTEDLKALREKRIQEMKKLNNKKQEWLRNVRTEHTHIFIYDIQSVK